MLSTGSSPTFAALILWLLTLMANSLPSDVSNGTITAYGFTSCQTKTIA